MGDLTSSGRGKNKKDAKTKAAENMVLKLEDLPKVRYGFYFSFLAVQNSSIGDLVTHSLTD